MSLTKDEREVFEELLRAGSAVVYHTGKSISEHTLRLAAEHTMAANRAERILDPLRTPAERAVAERQIPGRS